jgi:hypothetical protein
MHFKLRNHPPSYLDVVSPQRISADAAGAAARALRIFAGERDALQCCSCPHCCCWPLQLQCDDGYHQSIHPSIGTLALSLRPEVIYGPPNPCFHKLLSTFFCRQYVGHQEFYPRRKDCFAIDPYGICFNCDSSCCSCRLFQRSISARIGMVNSFLYSLENRLFFISYRRLSV